MDDRDKPAFVELLRVLDELDGWLARIDPGVPAPQPHPRSPLKADDDLLHPYQLSHAAWHSLSHAVDHLSALRSLLRDARVIHMYAPYSLVRGALENASAAVWMLSPPRRADRLGRRLRLAMTDIQHGVEAKRLMRQDGPRSEQERIDEVHDIARRGKVAGTIKGVNYSHIVKTAEAALSREANEGLIYLAWKLCSGMTHGDFWTTFGAAERIEIPGAPPGMGTFKITANVNILMFVTTFSTGMTRRGWQLYDRLSLSPF